MPLTERGGCDQGTRDQREGEEREQASHRASSSVKERELYYGLQAGGYRRLRVRMTVSFAQQK
jgi:hypothetical protein